MGFLKSPEIPLEGLVKIPLERLIKIPFEGNFCRFPRESEKTRTRAVGFLKTPEIPLEGNFFRFPREAEKSRTKAVRFLKSTEIPLEGLIFHPLHVADWPRVNGAHQLAVDTSAGVSVLDDQSGPKSLFLSLTPTHVFKIPKLDSSVDADSPWMLLQVPSKTSPQIFLMCAPR